MIWWLRVSLMAMVLISGFASRVDAVGTPVVTGSIMRDTTVGYFDFTIKITDVAKSALTAKERDLFKDRVRIWLPDLGTGTTDYVPFSGDTPIANVPFTLSQTADLDQTTNANNLVDFTYSLRISQNAAGGLKQLLDDKGGGKSVKLTIKYYEDTVEVTKLENTTISVSTSIVSSAPGDVAVKGTHRELIATWTVGNPTWSDGASTNAATGLTVLAIDKAATTTNLPAYIYDSSAVSDSEAAEDTCVFIPDFAEGASCISCSNANAYLNPTKLATLEASGIFTRSAAASTGKASVAGLTNGKPYAVVMFYQPGGLQRSACVTGTPEANTSWSELNGEKDASLSDPKCFVATAAYGSPLHKNLRPLRWFRDNILGRTDAGRAFVTWYYEHGPKAAKVVSSYPLLRVAVQTALWIPVMLISFWMYISGLDHGLMNAIVGSTLIALATLFLMGRYLRWREGR